MEEVDTSEKVLFSEGEKLKKTLICIFALCAFIVSCTAVPSTTEQEAGAVKIDTSNAIEPADTFSFSAGVSTIAVGMNHSLENVREKPQVL